MQEWRDEADRWWSDVLRVPADAMRGGGVFGLDHLDHVGVMAAAGAAGPVVYGPSRLQPALREAAIQANLAGPAGFANWPDLVAALAPNIDQVLGPAWYGYATAETLAPAPGDPLHPLRSVLALSEADLPLLTALHQRTPLAEAEESGTTSLPAHGYVESGELLAVACLGTWHAVPTIGVLTDPRARGRGLARQVVIAAAREGLRLRPLVQYRAWHRNTASIAVAIRCGFSHYCDGLVIGLTPSS